MPITPPTGFDTTKPWTVYSTYSAYSADISNNYNNLINNINKYNTSLTQINKYDTIDDSGNLLYLHDNNNPSSDIKDVLLQDNNDILVQQNMTYIIGMITTSTLIIAAIMISRR